MNTILRISCKWFCIGLTYPYTFQPPRFSFYDAATPIYTSRRNLPPSKIDNSKVVDSIISHGSFLTDCSIEHSVVGIRSRINSGVHLKVCFTFPPVNKPMNSFANFLMISPPKTVVTQAPCRHTKALVLRTA
ncbi:hypothetical protein SLEP1_g46448 [Rubroshorea leprosula]|uniref:glucose-1-phosphate adenylyltransferase n=1 Tax=Rubroshorea leprosula TaxID=152421 RepID=A0AAV5LP79_9ROSI|nr:hypothetical protein SLEP1_g46448 [Rubroshorea leprosula]